MQLILLLPGLQECQLLKCLAPSSFLSTVADEDDWWELIDLLSVDQSGLYEVPLRAVRKPDHMRYVIDNGVLWTANLPGAALIQHPMLHVGSGLRSAVWDGLEDLLKAAATNLEVLATLRAPRTIARCSFLSELQQLNSWDTQDDAAHLLQWFVDTLRDWYEHIVVVGAGSCEEYTETRDDIQRVANECEDHLSSSRV